MRQCEMVCLISWEVETIGEMLGRIEGKVNR
jgi:hypothetical protein